MKDTLERSCGGSHVRSLFQAAWPLAHLGELEVQLGELEVHLEELKVQWRGWGGAVHRKGPGVHTMQLVRGVTQRWLMVEWGRGTSARAKRRQIQDFHSEREEMTDPSVTEVEELDHDPGRLWHHCQVWTHEGGQTGPGSLGDNCRPVRGAGRTHGLGLGVPKVTVGRGLEASLPWFSLSPGSSWGPPGLFNKSCDPELSLGCSHVKQETSCAGTRAAG